MRCFILFYFHALLSSIYIIFQIVCFSPSSSVPLMATTTSDGHVVVWDIEDELQVSGEHLAFFNLFTIVRPFFVFLKVRTRVKLKVDEKILAGNIEEQSEVLELGQTGDLTVENFKETLEGETMGGIVELFEEGNTGNGDVAMPSNSRKGNGVFLQATRSFFRSCI